jgi:cell division protein FtsB
LDFSFNRGNQPAAGHDTSKISNERLRKAIERNKQKMLKRTATRGDAPAARANSLRAGAKQAPSLADKLRRSSSTPPGVPGAQPSRSSMGASKTSTGSSSLLDKMRARKEAAPAAKLPATSPSLRRKPITDASNIEMQAPVARAASTTPSVGYGTTTPAKGTRKVSAKRKVKTKNKIGENLSSWFVKGSWLFCGFLLMRLIFSDGGALEFYNKSADIKQKQFELEMLKQDNQNLMQELENIRTSGRFQKKLVRDHLGYIAKDEYLILFSKNLKTARPQEVSSI